MSTSGNSRKTTARARRWSTFLSRSSSFGNGKKAPASSTTMPLWKAPAQGIHHQDYSTFPLSAENLWDQAGLGKRGSRPAQGLQIDLRPLGLVAELMHFAACRSARLMVLGARTALSNSRLGASWCLLRCCGRFASDLAGIDVRASFRATQWLQTGYLPFLETTYPAAPSHSCGHHRSQCSRPVQVKRESEG